MLAVRHTMDCSCGKGSISPYHDEEEPGMYRCSGCGKTDYPDAFNRMVLINDMFDCPHCKKKTQHRLYYFDDWSGYGETECTECETKVPHNRE